LCAHAPEEICQRTCASVFLAFCATPLPATFRCLTPCRRPAEAAGAHNDPVDEAAAAVLSEALQAYLRQVVSGAQRCAKQRQNIPALQFADQVEWRRRRPFDDYFQERRDGELGASAAEASFSQRLKAEVEELEADHKRALKEHKSDKRSPEPVHWLVIEEEEARRGELDWSAMAWFQLKVKYCRDQKIGDVGGGNPGGKRRGSVSDLSGVVAAEGGGEAKRARTDSPGRWNQGQPSNRLASPLASPAASLPNREVTLTDVVAYLDEQQVVPRAMPVLQLQAHTRLRNAVGKTQAEQAAILAHLQRQRLLQAQAQAPTAPC